MHLTSDVAIPLWALLLLIATTLVAVLDRIFIPSVRWFVRGRVNRAIDQVSSHLRIDLRPFQLTKRQVLIDRLSYDTQVVEAMTAYAKERDMPREVAQERVREYAREIVPSFNAYVYFRVGYWLAKKIARLLYSVRVGFLDPNRLRTVDPNATVVFVMNHRSNMDYILVAYLVARSSALSYAAGEWARVWPLQTLVRAMGAFFVRRDSRDPLYRKVLERYVHMATEEGVPQAVFPEGGLSHDGLLRTPKLGILDYMLRTFDPEKQRDIVFIPVGINYDRVTEDKSLLHRRDPDAPRRSRWFVYRTVWRFWRKNMALSVDERRRRFGYASVNFGEPLSAKAYCEEQGIAFPALDREQRFDEVARLADRLMERVAQVIPILPAPLVATVFQRDPETWMDAFEVKRRVHDLVHELQEQGAPIRDTEIPKERTLNRAIDMLRYRNLVEEEDGRYRLNPEGCELVRFYANSIAHWSGASSSANDAQTRSKRGDAAAAIAEVPSGA